MEVHAADELGPAGPSLRFAFRAGGGGAPFTPAAGESYRGWPHLGPV